MFKLSKKSFTILETILSVAIFTILMGIVFRSLMTSRNIYLKSSAKSNLIATEDNALALMKKELSETSWQKCRVAATADDLNGNTPPASGSGGPLIIFAIPTDTDGDSSVLAADGNLQWGCDGVANRRIRYRLDTVNNNLLRETIDCTGTVGSYNCSLPASGNSRIIAGHMDTVSPIDFLLDTNTGSVTVTMNLKDDGFTSEEVKISQSLVIKLRN